MVKKKIMLRAVREKWFLKIQIYEILEWGLVLQLDLFLLSQNEKQ